MHEAKLKIAILDERNVVADNSDKKQINKFSLII